MNPQEDGRRREECPRQGLASLLSCVDRYEMMNDGDFGS